MGVFDFVGGLVPRRSGFHLPERKICDFDMGDIVPVYCRMAIPGDVWKFNFSAVLRAMPMVAPTFTSIDCSVYAFLFLFGCYGLNGINSVLAAKTVLFLRNLHFLILV